MLQRTPFFILLVQRQMQNGINSPKVHRNSTCAPLAEAAQFESVFENVIYSNSIHLVMKWKSKMELIWCTTQQSRSEIKMFIFTIHQIIKLSDQLVQSAQVSRFAAKLFIYCCMRLFDLFGSFSFRVFVWCFVSEMKMSPKRHLLR